MPIDISPSDDEEVLRLKIAAAGLQPDLYEGEIDALLDARSEVETKGWAPVLGRAIRLVDAAGGGTVRIPERPPDGGLVWPIVGGASPHVTRGNLRIQGEGRPILRTTADAAPSNAMLDLIIEGAWRVEIRDLWLDTSLRMANGLHVHGDPAPGAQGGEPGEVCPAGGRRLDGPPPSVFFDLRPALLDLREALVVQREHLGLVSTAGGLVLGPEPEPEPEPDLEPDPRPETASVDIGDLLAEPADRVGQACASLSVRNLTVTNCRQWVHPDVKVAATGISISGGFQRGAELEDCVVDGVWRAAAVNPADGPGAGIDIHPDTVRLRYCHTTVVRHCTVANVLDEVQFRQRGNLEVDIDHKGESDMDGEVRLPRITAQWTLPYAVNPDMDGLKVLTLKSARDSSALVENCTFVDCEYRAIKTQVASTSVTACTFLRTLRRGHMEIDAQFGSLVADGNTLTWRRVVAGGGINRTCRAGHPRGPMRVVGNTFVCEWAGGWDPPENHYPVQAVAALLAVPPVADPANGGERNPEYLVLRAQHEATRARRNVLDHVLVRDNNLQVVPIPGLAPPSLDAPCCALLSLTASDGGEFLVDSNHVPGCVRALVTLDSNDQEANAPRFRGGLVDNQSDIPTLAVLERRGAVLVRGPWHDNADIVEDLADLADRADLWRCPL